VPMGGAWRRCRGRRRPPAWRLGGAPTASPPSSALPDLPLAPLLHPPHPFARPLRRVLRRPPGWWLRHSCPSADCAPRRTEARPTGRVCCASGYGRSPSGGLPMTSAGRHQGGPGLTAGQPVLSSRWVTARRRAGRGGWRSGPGAGWRRRRWPKSAGGTGARPAASSAPCSCCATVLSIEVTTHPTQGHATAPQTTTLGRTGDGRRLLRAPRSSHGGFLGYAPSRPYGPLASWAASLPEVDASVAEP
jgi:hypothetical protein